MNKIMRGVLLKRVFGLLPLTLVLILISPSAFAQSSSDDAWYWQLIKSVGQSLYLVAWPTDTYDHMEFGHIERAPGGADVSVVLYGHSWLEGDLWTEVVTQIRNGSVTGIHFGRYSPKALFAPGSTVKAWGQALDQVNQDMNRQRRQQTTAPSNPLAPQAAIGSNLSVICISNPTQNPIAYSLPSEQIFSKTIAPGQTWMFWHDGPGLFTVSFNGMQAATYSRNVHAKGATLLAKPDSCDDKMIYEFIADGGRIGIAPRTWVPGSENTFTPNLYRAETEGKWVCGNGYQWASSNENDTTCVLPNTGFVGLTINIDRVGSYPVITAVQLGSSASVAGIMPGLLLMKVDGSSTLGLDADAVAGQIRGPMNTIVQIGIGTSTDGSIQYLNLRRQ